jgi:hypothetical protein
MFARRPVAAGRTWQAHLWLDHRPERHVEHAQRVAAERLPGGKGDRVLRIAKDRIPLSSSVTDPSVYPIVEKALGMDFTGYALGRAA